MKKITALMLTVLICISFAACTKTAENNSNNNTATAVSSVSATENTTEQIIEKTTSPPKSDSQKGSELRTAVMNTLGNKENAEISGELEYGKFTYKYSRDADVVYANERDNETEKLATDNAQKLADSISNMYNDELKLHSNHTKQIGTGENGIDSVQYQFYYINSQNQLLTIYADSDGEISYADCKFTW